LKLGTRNFSVLRAVAIIFGIILGAIGGVIAYRAFFLEPSVAVVISNEGVGELPDTFRIIEGIVLLIVGAAIAFIAAVRWPKR
jgi:hypothetical protein